MNSLQQSVISNTKIEFLFDGRPYNDIYIQLIRNAKTRIILHTYIFELDEFGLDVYRELLNASGRGVSISLLVDGFGTNAFQKNHVTEMKKWGINYLVFNRPKWGNIYKWGRRLHHKVLLVDGHKGIIGGINIVSASVPKYHLPRLDFAFYLEGEIIPRIEHYCSNIFERKKKVAIPSLAKDPIQERINFSVNDWVHNRKNIANSYVRLLDEAKDEVVIINSYFFPRRKFLKKLIQTSKRGVLIKLILPKYSDWQSHVFASEYLYSHLLKNNISIYQWNKSILHGKMAMVDKKYLMSGSFNLNYTSFRGNLELNIEVFSRRFVINLSKIIDNKIIAMSYKIDKKDFEKNTPLFTKLKRFFCYIIISTASNFVLGFIHPENSDKESEIHRRLMKIRIAASFFIFFFGLIGLVLPFIPGMILLIAALILIYPVIIKNYKN